MKNYIITFALISPLFVLLACGQNYQNNNQTPMNYSNSSSVQYASFSDPRENAFTVSLPKDWKSQVSLERPYQQIRSCGVSSSPDGESKVFFGDPTLPSYMTPNPQMGMYQGMNTGNPLMVIMNFVPANQFFPGYVQNRYGQLPGFKITGAAPNHEAKQLMQQKLQAAGMMGDVQVESISFVFQENGKEVKAKINGYTLNLQNVWVADLNGYMTTGDPQDMEPILKKLITSHQTNPAWSQKQAQMNQQRMAQSQQQHQMRMQQRQAAFNAHQQRMQQQSNAMDQQMQNWRQNQAIQDQSHQQFIDYIRDENTVTNSTGTQTGKVQSGYNNYYVNPNTGEYIGTNSYTNPDPTVYQHWIIKR